MAAASQPFTRVVQRPSAEMRAVPICCRTKLYSNLRVFRTGFIYLVAVVSLGKRAKLVHYSQKQKDTQQYFL